MAVARVVVVGGGISGLTTAYSLLGSNPRANVTVLDEGSRPGGTARSAAVDGFTFDYGPGSIPSSSFELLELIDSLGLGDSLRSARGSKAAHLYLDERLQPVPTSPAGLLTSGLLSPAAKARLLLEPFVARKSDEAEETVYDFLARRLGRGVAEVFGHALVRGTTGGRADGISMQAQFPRLHQLERRHGSLLRGIVGERSRSRRQAKRRGAAGSAGPFSFERGGMGRLGEALATALGDRVRLGERAVALGRATGGARYQLRLESGETLPADFVVLATPAHASARLLDRLAPGVSSELAAIPYAAIDILGLGFEREDVTHALDGFGFLAAPQSDSRILGCQWTSSTFPDHSPPDSVLLRVMVQAEVGQGPAAASHDLLPVLSELERLLGISAAPNFVKIVRWPRALPQYVPGHQERVERIFRALRWHGGLFLTGNAYRGIGLDDCVRQAKEVAGRVSGLLGPRRHDPESTRRDGEPGEESTATGAR